MARILVVLAHPDLQASRANRALQLALAPLSGPGGPVEWLDLYARYPDYLIDVPAEQARLATAELIVWAFPLQWYSVPALLKLWIDEVLAFGWAYGPGADALRGKALWLLPTTGGSAASYEPAGHNRHTLDAFLAPWAQTARLCGLHYLPPLALHDAHALDAPALAAHGAQVRDMLARWPAVPAWQRLLDGDCADCAVPAEARPLARTGGGWA